MFEYFKHVQEALLNIWAAVMGSRFGGYLNIAVLIGLYIGMLTAAITAFSLVVQPFVAAAVPDIVSKTFGLVVPSNAVPCMIAYYTLRFMRTMFLFKTALHLLVYSRLQAARWEKERLNDSFYTVDGDY